MAKASVHDDDVVITLTLDLDEAMYVAGILASAAQWRVTGDKSKKDVRSTTVWGVLKSELHDRGYFPESHPLYLKAKSIVRLV